jgi:hypothetical protein
VGSFSYKLDRLLLTQHSFSVTLFTLGFRLFFILLQINQKKKDRVGVVRSTQCVRGVLDPPVSAISLSLYRHPFLYTLFSSRFTLIINNNTSVSRSHTHPSHSQTSRLLTSSSSGFECSSPPLNPVYPRRVDPQDLDFSLSSHRYSFITPILVFHHTGRGKKGEMAIISP